MSKTYQKEISKQQQYFFYLKHIKKGKLNLRSAILHRKITSKRYRSFFYKNYVKESTSCIDIESWYLRLAVIFHIIQLSAPVQSKLSSKNFGQIASTFQRSVPAGIIELYPHICR